MRFVSCFQPERVALVSIWLQQIQSFFLIRILIHRMIFKVQRDVFALDKPSKLDINMSSFEFKTPTRFWSRCFLSLHSTNTVNGYIASSFVKKIGKKKRWSKENQCSQVRDERKTISEYGQCKRIFRFADLSKLYVFWRNTRLKKWCTVELLQNSEWQDAFWESQMISVIIQSFKRFMFCH